MGRISYVEGDLLRYVPEEKDWEATVEDVPFGLDDALYSDDNAKAEFIMPNGTWIRMGGVTQIQLLALNEKVTEVDVASGVARFYNNGTGGVVKATTPFGYVVAPAGSSFDLYVGDSSVEVIPLRGKVDFIHEADNTRYDVSGSSSLIADSRDVSSGQGVVDADWDDWNKDRDDLWRKRTEVQGESVRYLPEGLRDEAYELDDNGRWERVYYDGDYHQFWRPARVSAGWTPFSEGRWVVYHGDNCWVPEEPFGYVTHHYGNWVYADDDWYWAPPVVSVGVNVAPAVGIGFAWYPGRVAWIHRDRHVGWFPLAPREVYYGHRHWGRHASVIHPGDLERVTIDPHRYRYADRAVVVDRDHFYRAKNYHNVRINNINKTTIINDYRGAPVVSNRMINNFDSMKERYRFKDAPVSRKPHQNVLNRIEHNEAIARHADRANPRSIERDVQRMRPGNAERMDRIHTPKVTKWLVNADAVNRPGSEIQFEQKELKRNQRMRREGASATGPGSQGREGARFGRPATSGDLQRDSVLQENAPSPDVKRNRFQRLEREGRPEQPAQPQGDASVPDAKRNRFQRLEREGRPEQPVQPQGDVSVPDVKRNRFQRLEREGRPEQPVQPQGDVSVPDVKRNRFQRMEREGRPEQPVQPQGDVSVPDVKRNRFQRLEREGRPEQPVQPQGDVSVPDAKRNRFQRLEREGRPEQPVQPQGDVSVPDAKRNRFQRLEREGRPEQPAQPQGDVSVPDVKRNRFQQMRREAQPEQPAAGLPVQNEAQRYRFQRNRPQGGTPAEGSRQNEVMRNEDRNRKFERRRNQPAEEAQNVQPIQDPRVRREQGGAPQGQQNSEFRQKGSPRWGGGSPQ
ncbi:DUF6600 domain-containing protein [Desulforhabdus sp. TSK]|uniref:DUF6600 domain-containing protein n=1 Tax=Desulforhabdus sp. TSK TaxID=2925014 RepID=UPI001FC858B9|nr:DUF6600 domain-containing protein [Desulforhabdus sp. TSK]